METIVQRNYDKEKHLQLIKNNIKNSERDDYSILIDYQIFYERNATSIVGDQPQRLHEANRREWCRHWFDGIGTQGSICRQ